MVRFVVGGFLVSGNKIIYVICMISRISIFIKLKYTSFVRQNDITFGTHVLSCHPLSSVGCALLVLKQKIEKSI